MEDLRAEYLQQIKSLSERRDDLRRRLSVIEEEIGDLRYAVALMARDDAREKGADEGHLRREGPEPPKNTSQPLQL